MTRLQRDSGGRVAAALLAVACLPLWTAHGADAPDLKVDKTPIERSAASGSSYAAVVKQVAPSVVNIYSERVIRNQGFVHPFLDDPLLRRFFGGRNPSPGGGRGQSVQNLGSGVVVTEDGYILTNNHVVEGADKVQVVLAGGKVEYTAKIIGTDPQTDIAVLKVDAKKMPAITFADSDQLEVGDVVLAVGNPMRVGQSVTMGIISALGRGVGILGREGYEDFIQTDAAINPGNSGGALVDTKGRLIGINQSIVSQSGGNEGIGFAVPVNLARNVLEQIISNGEVSRGFIGVTIQTLTPDLAKAFNIDDANGALVSEVTPGGPGDDAGLKAGDVIVRFDGKRVDDSAHLRLMAAQTKPGTKVDLKVIREGKGLSLTVKLGKLPKDLAEVGGRSFNPPASGERDGLDGVVVDDLDRDARRQYDIPDSVDGALVVKVDQDSNAYEAGLREGDVIVEIDQHPVKDAESAVDLSERADRDKLLLRVWSQRTGLPGLIYVVVDNTKRK